MAKEATTIFLLVIINIPVYLMWGKLIFGSLSSFTNDFQLNWQAAAIMAIFFGEIKEDVVSKLKSLLFVAACILTVLLEYLLIDYWIMK